MTLTDRQQRRLLERLQQAGEQPLSLDQLRAEGIDFPAVVIGELELNGYAIERVYEHGKLIGVRLRNSESSQTSPSRPPRRWPRRRATGA
jgi:hypothetical protein